MTVTRRDALKKIAAGGAAAATSIFWVDALAAAAEQHAEHYHAAAAAGHRAPTIAALRAPTSRFRFPSVGSVGRISPRQRVYLVISFPSSAWERLSRSSALRREAELQDARSQAEPGNETDYLQLMPCFSRR